MKIPMAVLRERAEHFRELYGKRAYDDVVDFLDGVEVYVKHNEVSEEGEGDNG